MTASTEGMEGQNDRQKRSRSEKIGQRGTWVVFGLSMTIPLLILSCMLFPELKDVVEDVFNKIHLDDFMRFLSTYWWLDVPALFALITAFLYMGYVRAHLEPGTGNRVKWVLIVFAGMTVPAVLLWMALFASLLSGTLGSMFSTDTVESVLHCLLMLMLPINNIWVLNRVLKNDLSRPTLMGFVNGGALSAAFLYSLLAFPWLLQALKQVFERFTYIHSIFDLFGIILGLTLLMGPMTALGLCFFTSKKLLASDSGNNSSDGIPYVSRVSLRVLASAIFIMIIPGTQELVTKLAVRDAAVNSEKSEEAIRLLRRFQCRGELLRKCYWPREERLQLLPLIVYSYTRNPKLESWYLNQNHARQAIFRLTGRAFNEYPRPNKNASLSFWGIPDPDLAGKEVGAKAEGLSLASSTIDCFAYESTLATRMLWTMEFTNTNKEVQEARGLILLPPDSVVSDMKLWIKGEPRAAVFNSRRKVRAAYRSVVLKRRDPALVTTSGTDRVLFQCYPVPVNGRMKVQLQISTPYSIRNSKQSTIRLPHFLIRNFTAAEKHHLKLQVLNDQGEAIAESKIDRNLTGDELVAATLPLATPDLKSRLVPNLVEELENAVIVQSVTKKSTTPISDLVLVLDCSRSMSGHIKEISKAVDNLPDNLELTLLFATRHRSKTKVFEKMKQSELAKIILEEHPVLDGGEDNLPALRKALRLYKDSGESSALLWIHGPQPVLFDSDYEIQQSFSLLPPDSRLYEIEVKPAKNKLSEVLQESEKPVASFKLVRPSKPGDTLADLVGSLTGKPQGMRINRIEAHFLPSVVSSLPKASSALKNAFLTADSLWAADYIDREIKSGNRERACRTAVAYRVVTPVSGAVVLETEEQYRRAGLDQSTGVSPYDANEGSGRSSRTTQSRIGPIGGGAAELSSQAILAPSPAPRAVYSAKKENSRGAGSRAPQGADMGSGRASRMAERNLAAGDVASADIASADMAAPAQPSISGFNIAAGSSSQEAELSSRKADLESKMSAKGKVVYATKDIPEGHVIYGAALEEKEVEQSKIPQDAITSDSLARGRITKYGISQGQIISQHDLGPEVQGIGGRKDHVSKSIVVYSKREIKEGETIPADALEERVINSSKLPQGTAVASNVVGRKARVTIMRGQMISKVVLDKPGSIRPRKRAQSSESTRLKTPEPRRDSLPLYTLVVTFGAALVGLAWLKKGDRKIAVAVGAIGVTLLVASPILVQSLSDLAAMF